ncbi:MAG: formyl transferase [Alcaligenaceae bacterium]|nr:MAG: formyl transferase [Alcaligenaceae bacterium]
MIRILLMGRKKVTADLLERLVKNKHVSVVGVLTDNHLEGSLTTLTAERHGIRLFTFEEASRALKIGDLCFDLGLSVLYWRKLKEEFLTIPSKGVINFHPAPLPQYKGTGGYNLAILEAKSYWGVSAHYVDESIDTGPIIAVREFDIDVDAETCVSLERKSMMELERLVNEVVSRALDSPGLLESKCNVGGRYVSRQEMEAMKRIDPADDLERKIRAFWFPPYDGAYIEIDGAKYTLVSRPLLESLAPLGSTSLFTDSKKC